MFAIPAHLNAPSTPNPSNNSNTRMNSAAQTGSRSILRASLDQSRSARNVFAGSGRATLPILERGGSTRNFRELPDRRRNGSQLESPAPSRSLTRGQRRSNSTRRFFVADQSVRSNGTSSATTASTLGERFRRITLERTDSASSMGSIQSSVCGGSNQRSNNNNNNNSFNNNSNHFGLGLGFGATSTNNTSIANLNSSSHHSGHGGGGNNNNHNNNYQDSFSSALSMDSLSLAANAATLHSFGSFNPEASFHNDLDDSEADMMSLFSKDSVSVRVRQVQMDASASYLASSLSLSSDHRGRHDHLTADEDMVSMADGSESTLYSFDLRPPALSSLHR